jgi:hypothetical protein
MAQASLKSEVDHNYDYFQRNLEGFLKDHPGEYALLKSGAVISFHPEPGDAYRTGLNLFSDEIFSIQEVTNQPVDLGFMSLGFA